MIRHPDTVAPRINTCLLLWAGRFARFLTFTALFASAVVAAPVADKDKETLTLDIAAPEAVVVRAVQEVSKDGIVHGTYVYDKDKTLTGAQPAESSKVLTPLATGKNFYKVAEGAIAPRFFKDTQDIGSITVRYNVQSISEGSTRMVIDAIFVEDGRKEKHESTGVVENSEFEAVQQHVRKIIADQAAPPPAPPAVAGVSHLDARPLQPDATASTDVAAEQQLKQRIVELRHKVEMRSRNSTALKSAPFQSATTLLSLPPSSELIVLVITPYWYGVETTNGRHGWVHKSQLEPLP